MWNQLWIPVLIPTLIIKSNCDINKTDSDVVVHYSGHAEAEIHEVATTKIPTTTPATIKTTTDTIATFKINEEMTEDVVFIPNDKPNRDSGDGIQIKDVLSMKTVGDVMNNKNFHVLKEDEGSINRDTPNEDVVFITGKNHDIDKVKSESNARRNNIHQDQAKIDSEYEASQPKLDCSHLYCNNSVKSICGARFVNNEWKFRLFLNDCYLRKVNCGFKYDVNRYKEVSMDKCNGIGSHLLNRPFSFKPKPLAVNKEKPIIRSTSSRRSMTMFYNGQICSHPCPVTCPDDYDPQCAVSSTGQRRVFLNHCKLDYNSCFYSVVWHKRPLADCVGGRKADMRQNRAFIGWMQRVGIVDNRGRLIFE